MRFESHLSARDLEGPEWRLRLLTEPLIYWIDDASAIIVADGFVTDGASIPRFLWAVYPPFGPWARAGVVHDYLCCRIAAGNPHIAADTRTRADLVFYGALRSLALSRFTCAALYIGATLGTWFGVRAAMIDHNEKLRALPRE